MLTHLRIVALFVAVVSVSLVATAGEFNPTLSIGDVAPSWQDLPGIDGKTHSRADFDTRDVLVVVFTCNSCPYAVDYEDRLVEFQRDVVGKSEKVGLVAINVNKIPDDSLEKMQERAQAKGFTFPYLFDESQQIAKDFGATRTPEFFVLDKARKVAYMGAMDDNSMHDKVTKQHLRDAVAAVLAGQSPETKETPPVGCGIRFERMRRKARTDN
jgi:peroxiredoxin